MRLAVSLIAWEPAEDDRAAQVLATAGVAGIEVAPTRVWGSWEAITPDAVRRWGAELAEQGLTCPALQSLFYGVDRAMLTGDREARRVATKHLVRVSGIAGALGARVAVLGSPGNRRRGDLTEPEALGRLRESLLPAAEAFAECGAAIGLEANPPEYGCDLLTRYGEVAAFIDDVGHPGLRPHLDLGGLRLSEEDPLLDGALPAHVHLSAPHLTPFDAQPRDWHETLLARLRSAGYAGWCSIEQRANGTGLTAPLNAVGAARRLLSGLDA